MSIDIAWAAGLIDGEGCVCIMKRKRLLFGKPTAPTYFVILKVSMGCKKAVLKLKRIFGVGSVHLDISHKRNARKWNKYHVWLVQQRDCEQVLELLYKYSVTKLEEIDVALQFLQLPLAPRGGKYGSKPTPDKFLKQREKLFLKMKNLKPRSRLKAYWAKKDKQHGKD